MSQRLGNDNKELGAIIEDDDTQEDEGIQRLLTNSDGNSMREVRDRNKAPLGAPVDFALFDFAKMEKGGNQLLNARDDWAHAEQPIPALRYTIQWSHGRGTARSRRLAGGGINLPFRKNFIHSRKTGWLRMEQMGICGNGCAVLCNFFGGGGVRFARRTIGDKRTSWM